MNKPNIRSQAHLLKPLSDDSFFNANHPIICENGVEHTYTLFKKKVQFLASKLCETKMNPQDCVAMALPRGLEAAIAIYAVLYEGDIYVPVDIKKPNDRLSYIEAIPHLRNRKIDHQKIKYLIMEKR